MQWTDKTVDTEAILAALREAIPGDWQERMRGTEYVLRSEWWKIEVDARVLDGDLWGSVRVLTIGGEHIASSETYEPDGDKPEWIGVLVKRVAPVVAALREVERAAGGGE